MTLKAPNTRVRTIVCDQPRCDWEFAGESGQRHLELTGAK